MYTLYCIAILFAFKTKKICFSKMYFYTISVILYFVSFLGEMVDERSEIALLIKCPECDTQFFEPLMLPCGYVVCKACMRKSLVIKSSGVNCKSCSRIHLLPINGFPSSKLTLQLLEIVSRSQQEAAKGQQLPPMVQQLRGCIKDLIQTIKNLPNDALASPESEIGKHFDTLRDQVQTRAEAYVERIHACYQQLMSELDASQRKFLDNMLDASVMEKRVQLERTATDTQAFIDTNSACFCWNSNCRCFKELIDNAMHLKHQLHNNLLNWQSAALSYGRISFQERADNACDASSVNLLGELTSATKTPRQEIPPQEHESKPLAFTDMKTIKMFQVLTDMCRMSDEIHMLEDGAKLVAFYENSKDQFIMASFDPSGHLLRRVHTELSTHGFDFNKDFFRYSCFRASSNANRVVIFYKRNVDASNVLRKGQQLFQVKVFNSDLESVASRSISHGFNKLAINSTHLYASAGVSVNVYDNELKYLTDIYMDYAVLKLMANDDKLLVFDGTRMINIIHLQGGGDVHRLSVHSRIAYQCETRFMNFVWSCDEHVIGFDFEVGKLCRYSMDGTKWEKQVEDCKSTARLIGEARGRLVFFNKLRSLVYFE